MKVTHYPAAVFGNTPESRADFARTVIQESTQGKVFSGKFLKTDGSIRTFNARAYAEGSVKGSGRELPKHIVPFIDNELLIKNLKDAASKLGRKLNKEEDIELIESARQKSWRSFKGDNILELNINGEKIIFQNA